MNLHNLFKSLCDNEYCSSKDDFFSIDNNTSCRYDKNDIEFVVSYFSGAFNKSLLDACMRLFYELSFNAFDILLHAWLSDLPVEKEIFSFGTGLLNACQNQKNKQRIAERIITDRSDSDTRIVLKAAGKTGHEAHRMMGLLRFSPDCNGRFTAVCEPDHFILPCLGVFFSSRFGEEEWSILDKKRNLLLSRSSGERAKITVLSGSNFSEKDKKTDEWETLWKHYHRTINNEERNNPGLQRQLMPKRYWKYLPEK